MPSEKSAGTILFQGSPPEFLLLHYPAGHWDFPKGNIEKGEKPEATALRELREETGISDAALFPGFKQTIRYIYRSGGRVVYKQVIFFLARTSQRTVTISFEHTGSAWLPYQKALEKLTFENAKAVLRKAHGFLRKNSR